jgi:hypothetical protein
VLRTILSLSIYVYRVVKAIKKLLQVDVMLVRFLTSRCYHIIGVVSVLPEAETEAVYFGLFGYIRSYIFLSPQSTISSRLRENFDDPQVITETKLMKGSYLSFKTSFSSSFCHHHSSIDRIHQPHLRMHKACT